MKAIFLDVDGVLNCSFPKSRSPSGCLGVDNDKVKLLCKIVRDTGARIVLTSSWKDGLDAKAEMMSDECLYLANKLKRYGLFISSITNERDMNRGHGIRDWLKKCKNVDAWVVLDDDIFPDYKELGILPHLVKTSYFEGGLGDEHVSRAIEILNAPCA